jgi:hypothetical protein
MMRKPIRPVNTETTLDDGTKVYQPICEEREICPVCKRGTITLEVAFYQCSICGRAFIDPNRRELLGEAVTLATEVPVAFDVKGGVESSQEGQVEVPLDTIGPTQKALMPEEDQEPLKPLINIPKEELRVPGATKEHPMGDPANAETWTPVPKTTGLSAMAKLATDSLTPKERELKDKVYGKKTPKAPKAKKSTKKTK